MWLAPKGHYVEQDPWGRETHEDTFACKHCQTLCFVKARTDPNEFFCVNCFAPICPACKKREDRRPPGPCSHFERRLEIYENRMAFHKTIDREKEWWGETPFG